MGTCTSLMMMAHVYICNAKIIFFEQCWLWINDSEKQYGHNGTSVEGIWWYNLAFGIYCKPFPQKPKYSLISITTISTTPSETRSCACPTTNENELMDLGWDRWSSWRLPIDVNTIPGNSWIPSFEPYDTTFSRQPRLSGGDNRNNRGHDNQGQTTVNHLKTYYKYTIRDI